MEEKRKHPRTDIDEPAYVSSGGSVMSCVVRNISLEGAAIDVENPAFVPQHFRLVMAERLARSFMNAGLPGSRRTGSA